MSLIAAHFPVLIAVVLFCLAAFMAFLMDYLKAYNDQLRERNIELSARQRERDRWLGKSPEAFVEKIAALLRTAQAMPPTALPAGAASVRARHRAATYGQTPPSGPQSIVPEPPEAIPVENATANPPENVAVQEPAAEALQDSAAPVAIEDSRRGRSKQRREPARIESWVSKEELEKLAERAARIRARYGAMAGEETQEPVPEPVQEDASQEEAVPISAEVRESAEPEAESVPQSISANDPPAADPPDSAPGSRWAFRESVGPFAKPDAQPSAAGDSETAVESQSPLEQVGEEQVAEEDAPALSFHSVVEPVNHVAQAAEPAPELWRTTPESEEPSIWAIPSTPAQAAVSAHLTGWQPEPLEPEMLDQEGASNVTEFPSPGPIHDLSLAEITGYEPGPYMPENPADRTQNDIDLDALFDQTYGSPSWLSIGTQESGGAVTSVLPTGLFEGSEFSTLMADSPSFTGVAVSIRINDFAVVKPKLSTVEGVEALGALDNLIRSLLREDRDFAGKAEEDEYVLLFPGDTGDEGQRRLFHLSERLWDFQLRSLGGLALMLSWGGLEVDDRPVPEAVSAARDRLEESRRGRAKPGSTFRSARRVS